MSDTTNRAAYNRQKAAHLLEVSRKAQELLEDARRRLGSAGGWGIFDILGGGFISGLIKHDHINGAEANIERARPLLEELGDELKELRVDGSLERGFGGLATFADFFFDGIFSDLYVQSKIRNLENEVIEVLGKLRQVDDALRKLDAYEARVLREGNE